VHKKRVYDHETSVFKNWKKDTPNVIYRCLLNDFHLWKVPRFIKDDGEVRLIEGTIKANWDYLNQIFLSHSAFGHEYPCLANSDLLNICRMAKLIDKDLTPE
jgi:hypothetical protein